MSVEERNGYGKSPLRTTLAEGHFPRRIPLLVLGFYVDGWVLGFCVDGWTTIYV